jgi:GNAT superfamily N-acetyltransferase
VNEPLEIERLSGVDVPLNAALSQSVGWHDGESEWRVLHEAAVVLGIRWQGQLVAQGALGDYGGAASLAKMVVSPEHQRRGFGGQLLDRLLRVADERHSLVGLCATEQGRPLYQSRGFSVSGELVILIGTPRLGTSEVGPAVPLVDAEPAIALDRRFSGCDRSRVLRGRLREAQVAFLLEGRGFAMATEQSPFSVLGPLLAETEQEARSLASAIFRAMPGPFRIDVPLEQVAFRAWLSELGLQERAQRVEMARGTARLPWQCAQRFALATQAWG